MADAPILGGTKKVKLDATAFGAEFNQGLVHEAVRADLAARRQGTHATKTRGNVRGGGAKPWRQKGTGRARQGSIRSPQWRGGGVALGPKPRSYRQRTPRKMVQLALRSALSDRAAEGRVVVVSRWGFDAPKTREAKAALGALEVGGRILVVLGPEDEVAAKSFRNLPEVTVLHASQLNAYEVLVADWVVFTEATLPGAPASTPVSVSSTESPAAPLTGEGEA